MGTHDNPYQAYTDGGVFSDTPLSLIVALYQGAIDGTEQAQRCLATRDIMGRSRAINKVIAILSELLASLDHQKGGEISRNLQRLYAYMQVQLLTAHARQLAEPMIEVQGLLTTMLEAWRAASARERGTGVPPSEAIVAGLGTSTTNGVSGSAERHENASTGIYQGYDSHEDASTNRQEMAYSF